MTKMKSKKMTKSTFAIIIMAIVMVAMLAFGGTYAYFTSQANTDAQALIDTATVKVGNATEITKIQNLTLAPGESTAKQSLALTSDSTTATYVFVKLDAVVNDTVLYVKSGETSYVSILEVALETATAAKWSPIATGSNIYYATVAANEKLTAFEFTVKLSDLVEANLVGDTETNNLFTNTTGSAYNGKIMGQPLKIDVDCSAVQQTGFKVDTDENRLAAYNASINTAVATR